MTLDQDEPRTSEAGGLALETYVAVYAAVGEGFPLEVVLSHEELDPEMWRVADAAWAERMMASADGDLALVDEYDRRLIEAQRRFSRRIAPLDDDFVAWMDFCRRWATEPDPLGKLAQLKLGRNDVIRIHRYWGERLKADVALRQQAEQILACSPGDFPVLEIEPAKLPPPIHPLRTPSPSSLPAEKAVETERWPSLTDDGELPHAGELHAPAPGFPPPGQPRPAESMNAGSFRAWSREPRSRPAERDQDEETVELLGFIAGPATPFEKTTFYQEHDEDGRTQEATPFPVMPPLPFPAGSINIASALAQSPVPRPRPAEKGDDGDTIELPGVIAGPATPFEKTTYQEEDRDGQTQEATRLVATPPLPFMLK